MKRMISFGLLVLLALFPLTSLAQERPAFSAEDYVTLGELREQALSGWQQTYTALGREIAVNVSIPWMPEADICPIIQIEAWGKQHIPQAALKTYRNIDGVTLHEFDCSLSIDYFVEGNDVPQKQSENYDESLYTQPPKAYYNGEIPAEMPENVDISYDELLAQIEAEIEPLCGLTWKDFRIAEIVITGVEYKAWRNQQNELVQGEPVTKWGSYVLTAQQLFHGIPIIGASGDYTTTPKGELDYSYYCPQRYSLTLSCSKEVAVHTPDVPLLSFDAMKRVLEAQINAGYLRCVDEMEFGYMAFYQGDPKSGNWLLMPVWRVLGSYTPEIDREDIVPYTDAADGSYHFPMEYYDYFYNAQTGAMLPTDMVLRNGKQSNQLEAGNVVTWDELGIAH